MTYLLGYKGESEKMKLDTDIDTCEFISELFLYIEKERYEMRYCLLNIIVRDIDEDKCFHFINLAEEKIYGT